MGDLSVVRSKLLGFPGGSVKNPSANARDVSSIPRLQRSPGEGKGNPLQYPPLGNPKDKGAWWATVHGVTRVRHNLATEQQRADYYLQRVGSSSLTRDPTPGPLYGELRHLSHWTTREVPWLTFVPTV